MSQTDQIFDHLKRHGTITPMLALREYGSMRLAARVEELRTRGHRIETRMIERRGKRFAEYTYYAKA
jgi:hypothetical protein